MTAKQLWAEFLKQDPPVALVNVCGMYGVTRDFVRMLGVSNKSAEGAIANFLKVPLDTDAPPDGAPQCKCGACKLGPDGWAVWSGDGQRVGMFVGNCCPRCRQELGEKEATP